MMYIEHWNDFSFNVCDSREPYYLDSHNDIYVNNFLAVALELY